MDYVSCQISSGSPGRSDLSRGWSSPCVSETQHVTGQTLTAHARRCAGLRHGSRSDLRSASGPLGLRPRASPRGRHDAPPGRESGRGARDGAGETDGETGRGLVACGCASRGRRVRVLLRDSTEHEDTRDSTGHPTGLSREVKVLSGYGPVPRDDSYRYSSFMTASMFHSGRAKTRQTRERDRFVRAESWSTDDRPHCTQRSAPRHRKLSTLSDG